MNTWSTTWFDYRTVWARTPWLAIYFVIVCLVFLFAVVGTFLGGPLAILFIPSLAGGYLHHLLVMRRVEQHVD